MSRVWTGLWVALVGALLAAVGAGVGWYSTRSDDAPEAVSAASPAEAGEKTAPTAAFPGKGHEIAQVRGGETVELLDRPGGKVVARVGHRTEFRSPTTFAVVKPRPRWLGVTAPELGAGKIGWLRYERKKLALGDTRLSVRVDLSESRLELMRGAEVMREVVVTVGAAGTDTPTGRYGVTDTIVEGLNPVYGAGAVVLSARQDSLPVGWAGGNIIAIHGWAGPVGGAASAGCLRTSNEDVTELIDKLPLGAPVFISA